jgi:hypothetical protein
MDLVLFCTAFILQFVGHRIGDYVFQTDWQTQNKAKNPIARANHVLVYSMTIGVLMLLAFDQWTAAIVVLITALEHYIIDSIKPIVGWKKLLEKSVGNKGFDIEKMPFFVLIEIDQSFHYARCLLIAVLIGYGVF